MFKLSFPRWLFFGFSLVVAGVLDAASGSSGEALLPVPLEAYSEIEAARASELGIPSEDFGLVEILKLRVAAEPLNLVTLMLFLGAIMHTFAAGWFMKLSKKYE
tara:strand:- start:16 stop:327 length:312 start_codon:yes stop_codon:yes gene_type:complete